MKNLDYERYKSTHRFTIRIKTLLVEQVGEFMTGSSEKLEENPVRV